MQPSSYPLQDSIIFLRYLNGDPNIRPESVNIRVFGPYISTREKLGMTGHFAATFSEKVPAGNLANIFLRTEFRRLWQILDYAEQQKFFLAGPNAVPGDKKVVLLNGSTQSKSQYVHHFVKKWMDRFLAILGLFKLTFDYGGGDELLKVGLVHHIFVSPQFPPADVVEAGKYWIFLKVLRYQKEYQFLFQALSRLHAADWEHPLALGHNNLVLCMCPTEEWQTSAQYYPNGSRVATSPIHQERLSGFFPFYEAYKVFDPIDVYLVKRAFIIDHLPKGDSHPVDFGYIQVQDPGYIGLQARSPNGKEMIVTAIFDYLDNYVRELWKEMDPYIIRNEETGDYVIPGYDMATNTWNIPVPDWWHRFKFEFPKRPAVVPLLFRRAVPQNFEDLVVQATWDDLGINPYGSHLVPEKPSAPKPSVPKSTIAKHFADAVQITLPPKQKPLVFDIPVARKIVPAPGEQRIDLSALPDVLGAFSKLSFQQPKKEELLVNADFMNVWANEEHDWVNDLYNNYSRKGFFFGYVNQSFGGEIYGLDLDDITEPQAFAIYKRTLLLVLADAVDYAIYEFHILKDVQIGATNCTICLKRPHEMKQIPQILQDKVSDWPNQWALLQFTPKLSNNEKDILNIPVYSGFKRAMQLNSVNLHRESSPLHYFRTLFYLVDEPPTKSKQYKPVAGMHGIGRGKVPGKLFVPIEKERKRYRDDDSDLDCYGEDELPFMPNKKPRNQQEEEPNYDFLIDEPDNRIVGPEEEVPPASPNHEPLNDEEMTDILISLATELCPIYGQDVMENVNGITFITSEEVARQELIADNFQRGILYSYSVIG